jgi:hypothetical protein
MLRRLMMLRLAVYVTQQGGSQDTEQEDTVKFRENKTSSVPSICTEER